MINLEKIWDLPLLKQYIISVSVITSQLSKIYIFSTGKEVLWAMLKASEAIVVDEYFGPVPEESQEEKMPALLRKG